MTTKNKPAFLLSPSDTSFHDSLVPAEEAKFPYMPKTLLLGPVYQALCLECGWAWWAKKPCSSAGIYHGANRSREKLCVFRDILLPSDLGRMAQVLHGAALLVLPFSYQTKPPQNQRAPWRDSGLLKKKAGSGAQEELSEAPGTWDQWTR